MRYFHVGRGAVGRLLGTALCGLMSGAAQGQAIIHNNVVKLGVDLQGQLNIEGGVPSEVLGTTAVGLRYLPLGNGGPEDESTAHGCYCEGWGIRAASPSFGAQANNSCGVAGLVVNSFTSADSFLSTATSDVSTTGGELRIVHDFMPSPFTANLYQVTVTVTNTSGSAISGIVYRRNMDWDVEQTAYDEFSTIDTYPTPGGPLPPIVLSTSVDGFVCSDPINPPTLLTCTGTFTDCGPADHGAQFDFDLGTLQAGESTSLTIFYGAAGNEPDALAALGLVGARVYSFGQPNITPPADHGEPNTFIFAFGGDIFDDCDRETIGLNSGFEHDGLGGGQAYPIGVLDAYYRILYDPDPGTSEPRPAATILKHPAWANPDPDTQWLGAYTTSQALLNGYYVFEVCFCLQEGFQDVQLTLGARADDEVKVFLNETLSDVINNLATPIHTGDPYNDPTLTFTTFTDQSRFQVGRNCLLFRVENTGSVAMGLDSVVTVSAPGFLAVDPTCCSNGSTISGRKWNDADGDGVWDDGELPLQGWTINLSDGSTATTDSNGYYYFNDLDGGTYVVTETQQPGWVQTYPAAGSHTVEIGDNEALEGFNFGNVFSPCGQFEELSVECIPGPEGWTGCWDITFTFTNLTDVTVNYVLSTDPNIQQHVIPLATPVPPGGTSEPVTLTLCGVDDADCYPLHIALADRFLEECCAIDDCVELPDCACLLFENMVIEGPTGDFLNYTMSFQVTNMTPDMVEHMFIVPEPPGGFTIVPDYIDLPTLPPGATSGTIATALGNLVPGQEYCVRVSIHVEDLTECCSKLFCFVAPDNGGDPCPADFNSDGVVDTRDVIAFLNAWTAKLGTADCDENGVIDSRDVICFLNAWNVGC